MREVHRGIGTTPGERYLAALCDRTFLDLWTYPNVYRNQGQNAEKGAGKEICDVLVVFDQHVIVFSEKSVSFPNSGNEDRDWRRWCDRAVVKSAKQVLGAERWISQHEDRIFVDPNCKQRLPVPLPEARYRKVHCIVIARGASVRCKNFFGGGNGSLFISCTGLPNSQTLLKAAQIPPFCTGDINPSGTYIHIIDQFNFDLILTELDTISDFVSYLNKKEQFVRSGHLINAAGEEELLAYYLQHADSKGEHHFPPPSGKRRWKKDEFLSLGEGFWSEMLEHPQYLAKKRENEISYVWDGVIGQFTEHMLAGTSIHVPEGSKDQKQEGGVRYMAAEPRVARRLLAKVLIDAWENAPADRVTVRAFMSRPGAASWKTGYIFLQMPFERAGEIKDYTTYRENRSGLLSAYCMVMASKNRRLDHVVGIASEPPKYSKGENTSLDMVLIDATDWTAEMQSEADAIRNELNIFDDERMRTGTWSVKEWPEVADELLQPRVRKRANQANRAQRRRRKALDRQKSKRPK